MTFTPNHSPANVVTSPPSLARQHDVSQLAFLREVMNVFHNLSAEDQNAFDRVILAHFSGNLKETWIALRQDLGMAHLEDIISRSQSTPPPLVESVEPEMSHPAQSVETGSETADSTTPTSPSTNQIVWMHPPWAPFPPVMDASYLNHAPRIPPVPVVSDACPHDGSAPSMEKLDGIDELLTVLNAALAEGESST